VNDELERMWKDAVMAVASFKVKDKANEKLSLCLTKYHAMKTYPVLN
jgi:hypothetical protein